MSKKRKRTAWLARDLFIGPYLAVCTSEAMYRARLKDLNRTDDGEWIHSLATARPFERGKRQNQAVILCFDGPEVLKLTPAELAGIITHECHHALDYYFTFIGETGRTEEIAAYCLQNLVTIVHVELSRQLANLKRQLARKRNEKRKPIHRDQASGPGVRPAELPGGS